MCNFPLGKKKKAKVFKIVTEVAMDITDNVALENITKAGNTFLWRTVYVS